MQVWPGDVAALTGFRDRPPLIPPTDLIERIRALGQPIGVDPVPLLGLRAAADGLTRNGSITCGGSGRIVACTDGWVCVNLPRVDDIAAVRAWLALAGTPVASPVGSDGLRPWRAIEEACGTTGAAALVDAAALLALPIAALGETRVPSDPVTTHALGPAEVRSVDGALVVDLSALWAGPLCGRLLRDTGARVVKVESSSRPDGTRSGPPAFFDALNGGKESIVIDFGSAEGRAELVSLVRSADVVVEASRPRALTALGAGADGLMAEPGGPQVWVSITGHGRGSERIAFGDDGAVAGGLVAWDPDRGPCMFADAVADPLTGVAAATAAVAALASGRRVLVDAALSGVAAWVSGPDRTTPGWRPHQHPSPLLDA